MKHKQKAMCYMRAPNTTTKYYICRMKFKRNRIHLFDLTNVKKYEMKMRLYVRIFNESSLGENDSDFYFNICIFYDIGKLTRI